MLGTHNPTKIACSLAVDGSPKNQRETLRTKLANAANTK